MNLQIKEMTRYKFIISFTGELMGSFGVALAVSGKQFRFIYSDTLKQTACHFGLVSSQTDDSSELKITGIARMVSKVLPYKELLKSNSLFHFHFNVMFQDAGGDGFTFSVNNAEADELFIK